MPNKQSFLANKQLFSDSMQKLRKHLATNYYELSKEYHYKDIEPRVFAEELLGANITAKNQSIENDDFQCKKIKILKCYKGLDDYRFHCFGGNIAFIQVANTTHTANTLFNTEWKQLPVHYLNPPSDIIIPKPSNLTEMLQIATFLSSPINYVRIDLFIINSYIFVGEMTFTPNGGTARFEPNEYDKKFGNLWQIAH